MPTSNLPSAPCQHLRFSGTGPLFTDDVTKCSEKPAGWRIKSSVVHAKETSVDRAKRLAENTRQFGVRRSTDWEKQMRAGLARMEWYVPRACPDETEWVHGGWKLARERTRAAMSAAGVPAARLDRWDGCGSLAVVQRNIVDGKLRVVHARCKDRFCRVCSERKRRSQVARLLGLVQDVGMVRMITLTLRHTDDPLNVTLDRLYACYRRLRQRTAWTDNVSAAAAACEVKIGDDGRWHAHLHILAMGRYWPHHLLSAEWLAVTGDSRIVDVRAMKDLKAVGYVAKYLAKGVPADVVNDQDKLVEAITALSGRRMLIVSGEWHGELADSAEFTDADGNIDEAKLEAVLMKRKCWKTIGSLVTYIMRARSGDRDSIEVLSRLRRHGQTNPKKVSRL
jgi:hypothetical protein